MFTKPLNLMVVYILTIINFFILLLPFAAVIIFFIKLNQQFILQQIVRIDFRLLLHVLIFCISFLMILYLFLDSIFGFSTRASLKDCVNYEKLPDFAFLAPLFKEVKERFGRKDVRLYVSKSNEINAFAVGSMSRKAIVLTKGIIVHSLNNTKDRREFLLILRSIMGHEMSHLVNKDYLPALLIITNQKATHFISTILEFTIRFPVIILGYLRIRSRFFLEFALMIYSFVNKIVTFFNRKIVFNFYEFIRRFISRSIEYRSDRQAAHAFGGHNMALALALFGNSGYFTLFSTHPSTKSRIKKVINIERKNNEIIRPLLSSSISNYLAFMFLIIICGISAKNSGMDKAIRYYITNHEILTEKAQFLFSKLQFLTEKK